MAAGNRVNLSPSMHHAWEACPFAARHRGASTSLSPRFQSRIGQKCASNCHLGIDTGKLKMRNRIATAIQHLGNLPVREDTAPRESANAAASRYGSPAAGPSVSLRDVFYQKRRGGRARLNAPDSKSGIPSRVSGVQIPLSPPCDGSGRDWRRYLEAMARDGLYSGGGNRFALASACVSG